MMNFIKAILVGLLIVSIAIFSITFYYSIFAILFITLAITMGYVIVKAREEHLKDGK